MGKYAFSVGDKVEVAGDAEEGFAGSFSVATIVSDCKDGQFKVQYDAVRCLKLLGGSDRLLCSLMQFVDEGGQLLTSKIPKDTPDLRPAPPQEAYLASFASCEVRCGLHGA
jgi:hypothetical protein